MKQPVIGFAGLTHLGLNSAVASAAKGFSVIGYHDDEPLIAQLKKGAPHVLEPQLPELMKLHQNNLNFSDKLSCLESCNIVYIAVDVPTDDMGKSDLTPIKEMINRTSSAIRKDAILVVLCQVPPGFLRNINWPAEQLFYQVETLIFGKAMERALYPERFILGSANPNQPLHSGLSEYLNAFDCPILLMRFESAELAKISINMCLVASVSTANILAEICEQIGADWTEIVPALRLDKRIGQYAYLNPGLGIAGGNLERDLRTVIKIGQDRNTDVGMVEAWFANSHYRKEWLWRTLRDVVLNDNPYASIAVLGLAYKENTHSTKNSPSLQLLSHLEGHHVRVHDPVVLETEVSFVETAPDALSCAQDANVLIIATPWPEYGELLPSTLAEVMAGRILIDPYRMIDGAAAIATGFSCYSLGVPPMPSFEGNQC